MFPRDLICKIIMSMLGMAILFLFKMQLIQMDQRLLPLRINMIKKLICLWYQTMWTPNKLLNLVNVLRVFLIPILRLLQVLFILMMVSPSIQYKNTVKLALHTLTLILNLGKLTKILSYYLALIKTNINLIKLTKKLAIL